MKIYQICRHNRRHTLNLDRVSEVVLGDGSVPTKKAVTIFVNYPENIRQFRFDTPEEAMAEYEKIVDAMKND
jgi:hypothetical protein